MEAGTIECHGLLNERMTLRPYDLRDQEQKLFKTNATRHQKERTVQVFGTRIDHEQQQKLAQKVSISFFLSFFF